MREHPRERGRHFLVRPEGEPGHRSSRASASATRKSSTVVTLRLYGESGATSTGKPARADVRRVGQECRSRTSPNHYKAITSPPNIDRSMSFDRGTQVR